MINYIKALLLISVVCVYYLVFLVFTKERYKSLFLITFVSYVSILLYICGLLNILKFGLYLFIIIGLGLFIFNIKYIKQINIKNALFCYESLFLLICLIWSFVLTRNIGISHIDDYSHWYRICKMIFYGNSLPTNADLLYRTYPPGTALWIYFITKFVGFDPQLCFFAQSIIIFSSLQCFFLIFENNKNIVSIILIILGTILITSFDTTFYVLLVDSLVGLIPLSCWIIIYKKVDYPFLFLLIINIYTALIKSSAIILVVFVSIFYLLKNKRKIMQSVSLVVIPLLFQYSYILRNNIIYNDTSNSSQALSLSRFLSVYKTKNSLLINDTIKYYIKSTLNIFTGVYQIKIIWLSIIILFIIYIITKSKNNKQLFLYCLGCFIVYAFGLLLVYLFSMSIDEANGNYLSCYFRYMGTMSIFIFGILYCQILTYLDSKVKIIGFMTVSLLFILISGNFRYLYTNYNVEGYDDLIWQDLQLVAHEEYEFNNKVIFSIINPEDYPDPCIDIRNAVLPCYFRTVYVYGYPINEIKENTFNDWLLEQLSACHELFTFRDYTQYLHLITDYIDIKDYHKGFCDIELR